jgi:hypothetical protein
VGVQATANRALGRLRLLSSYASRSRRAGRAVPNTTGRRPSGAQTSPAPASRRRRRWLRRRDVTNRQTPAADADVRREVRGRVALRRARRVCRKGTAALDPDQPDTSRSADGKRRYVPTPTADERSRNGQRLGAFRTTVRGARGSN